MYRWLACRVHGDLRGGLGPLWRPRFVAGSGRLVPKRRMRSHRVLMLTPAFDDDHRFGQRVKGLPVPQFVAQLAVDMAWRCVLRGGWLSGGYGRTGRSGPGAAPPPRIAHWRALQPANMGSGRPRTPRPRISKSPPSIRCTRRCHPFRNFRAEVMYSTSCAGPPKLGMVGHETGIRQH